MKNMYKKIKIFSALFLILFVSAVIVTNAHMAMADNVGQVQTTKFFAPETINMLKQRIAAGGSGGNLLKAGDTVSYIITFTPVNAGGNIGGGGYITDYIPPNTQVVGAEYVQPDGIGGYTTISVGQQSYMPSGWGARGAQVFGAPFVGAAQGAMSQVYADTGIFYSTDPRTSLYAGPLSPAALGTLPVFQPPTPGAKALQGTNGYRSEGVSGVLPPVPVFHNFWDTMMTYQFGSGRAGTIVPGGQGNTPYGAGSAVAGPDTFYQLDYTGAVGPWQRISYPGSMTGQGLPATAVGIPEINGVPTNAGWSLSSANPLPLNTNAVRFSFGKLQVGQFNYVKISLKLLSDPVSTGLQNNSEVMGGDSADTNSTNTTFISGGKDSVWKYAEGSVADNNSGFFILKEIISVNGLPSNGQNVVLNDVIRYRVTYINTGTGPFYLKFSDLLSTGLTFQPNSAVTLSGTNLFAAQPVFAASGTGTATTFPVTPILLNPGMGGSFQLDAKVTTAPASLFVSNTVTAVYGTTITTMTNTQQSVGVSNVGTAANPTPPNILQSKTASPNSIAPGSSTVYTITLTNNGTTPGGATTTQAASPSSTITDTLPAGFTYSTGTSIFYNNGSPVTIPSPSVITNPNGQQVVSWTIPAGIQIASGGGVWKVSFTADSSPTQAPATYYNDFASHIFYLSGNGATYVDASALQTAPVTVSKTRLVKSTTTPTIYMTANGATARYSVTLYNDNPSPLSNVNITDTLPSGFSYRAGTASSSINGGAVSAIPSGNITTGVSTVSFNMGTLAANSYMTIDFDVNIATSANIGTNNNTISGTANIGGSPVTIPPYTGAAVSIQPQGLVVNKFVSDSLGNQLPIGQNGIPFTPVAGATAASVYTASAAVYYTIELINSGNTYANNVGVTDILPTGFVYSALLNNASVSYRQSVNGVITTLPAPASTPVNDAAKTYTVMPKWSTFSIPPQQSGVSSKVLITFPVDVRQNTGGGALPVDVIKSATQYQNTVTADGANNIFSGAPVDVYNPISKVNLTPTVARGGQVTYRLSVLNNTSSSYNVNLSDVITTQPAPGTAVVWGFASDSMAVVLPVGATRPAVGATALNWANIPVPVGGLTFDFSVNIPMGVGVAVGKYDNTITATIGGIPSASSSYDGKLLTNTADDLNVVATAPVANAPPTLMKNTLNAATVAGPFVVASSPAPVYINNAGKIWYELVIQNNSSTAAGLTIGNTIDTLPNGFTVIAADLLAAGYKAVIRPKNSIPGTIAGANVTAVAPALAAMTVAGQNLTIPTTGKIIPASTATVPQGFEMAIIFRATIGTATVPVTSGQYSNTFTVNDLTAGNPALGTYNGGLVDVAPVRIAKTIDPASSTIPAGQTTSYTIELTNTNTTPVSFTVAKPLTVTDRLPFKTIAGVIPAASPVVFASTTSVYTYNPVTGLNTSVIPTTQPAATPPYTTANPVWTFQNLTIPAASNGISGKLVIVFTASTSAASAVDGQYLNTVGHSFIDPTVNSALTETDTFSGATLTISTITVTKTASVSFVTQTPQGASTSYQIRIQNPGTVAQTLAVSENLPFGFVYNPVAGASQSTATAVYVNRTTQASGTVSVANIRNSNGVGALAAANSQFYIASTAAALFVIPANTDLYINLNNIYIQPTVANGTYYNSLTTKNTAGQVINTLNNTAPVTVGAPYVLINKTTTTPIVSKNTVNSGTAIVHYDITLTNMGNASATGVVLTDLLPRLTPAASPAVTAYPVIMPATTVISITNNGTTTTLPAANYTVTQPAASNAITFNSNPAGGFTLPGAVGGNNGILTVGFDVSIPTGADIGTYYNTVNASTSNAGTISYNSGSPFSITAFGIIKSVVAINGNVLNTTNINTNDIVEYQIIATNTGPNNMPNLNITDILPAGFTYVLNSASITNTPVPPTAPLAPPTNPVGTSTLVWSPISTASNTAVTINFYAKVGAGVTPGTYYNVASVNDGGSQTVSTGNTAPVTLSSNPLMGIVKTVENASRTLPNNGSIALPGETLRYTITASVSVAVAKNIYVTDTIDPSIAYITGSEAFNLTAAPGLTFKNIEYYDRLGVLISSTAVIPAVRTTDPNIGSVIIRFNGTLTPPEWFRILLEAVVQ